MIQAGPLYRTRCMHGGRRERKMALVAEEWWERGERVDSDESA